MSLGEDRVRIKFNPSDNSVVHTIKQQSAELIDYCEENKNHATSGEAMRLWCLAQTHYEAAAMWAAKAATV